MGSSMTPPAPRDAPAPPVPRDARPASPSPGLRVAVKVALCIAGFAACGLLGYGGGLLIKPFVTAKAPVNRTVPAPGRPASAALPSSVPGPPAQASAEPPAASGLSLDLAVPAGAPAATAGHADAASDAPTQAARVFAPTASPHVQGKPPRGVATQERATSARAGKASCMAKLNAINSDLSLRNEPPTPEQLAILKRGCT